ncbi:TraG family conjugative transposon ATPase [Maribacter polysaccharolyticus]|uniref:TraG family conjugative transposon ATPase n=1 Tax=Maribacter polysaccharolyticus TaxID=3020831 RepID=UPI00237F45E2|nr:TraG family conjugative transposon ATPase [Maribacter polysaccharolyticus]MDE3744042.1 TraG family conjugative transposon ATPase [Maribacter polysaccharolyticus]
MKTFKLDYMGISEEAKHPIIYHQLGDYSTLLKITNPIIQFSSKKDLYYDYHNVMSNIVKILGEGYSIQKLDIITKKLFIKNTEGKDFLSKCYFEHFKGRPFRDTETYFCITKNVTKTTFYQFNQREFDTFLKKIDKVKEILQGNGFTPQILKEDEIQSLISRFLGFEFDKDHFSLKNFKSEPEGLSVGNKFAKSLSLINIDEVHMPVNITPFTTVNIGFEYPQDLFSFIYETPGFDHLIYHQYIQIPYQKKEIIKLEAKKKKHTSMPDPANDLAVRDIDDVLALIARENELLVYSHFNLHLYGDRDQIHKSINHIEAELFKVGIIPSGNCYNQLELYKSMFPGHSLSLKHYDKFFTTSSPALSLFYKETNQKNEKSDFNIYMTDRAGIPIAIDTSELPMETGRINNRNKFVLGPSGSGKSFCMNNLIKQYFQQETDIVLIDTGHSYSGLCEYYGGTYITYTDEQPITMNPFLFDKKEYNEEKRDFLKSLIAVLWKGTNGSISQVESSALIEVISAYYHEGFKSKGEFHFSFNTFYEYSIRKLNEISTSEKIDIDVNGYAYILKKFYKGGEYEHTLNSPMDHSLFDESFIVFEIDNIKDNEILFPITTIIIMDVFIQKMRHKKKRKALIIEEAWKAISSPMMAGYILYVYKTVRKFWGEAVVVTQDLEDIIGNSIVKNSIINNSDTLILLDQSKFKDNFDEVSNLLSLSETEQRKIFTINNLDNRSGRGKFKEVYIKRGSTGEVYGIEVSLEEYLTYTTERKEKDARDLYVHAYGNFVDGLTYFVKDMETSGLTLPDFVKKVLMESSQGQPINPIKEAI